MNRVLTKMNAWVATLMSGDSRQDRPQPGLEGAPHIPVMTFNPRF